MACPNFKKGLKMVSGPLGVNVQRVEFSLISWLHCVGVGASVISIAKNKWLCGHCWLFMQNCF
jgi:hypothetical protein